LPEKPKTMSSKEEAIIAGALHATKHNMKRRSMHHDYHAAGTYMITLVTQGRKQLFDEDQPSLLPHPHVSMPIRICRRCGIPAAQ